MNGSVRTEKARSDRQLSWPCPYSLFRHRGCVCVCIQLRRPPGLQAARCFVGAIHALYKFKRRSLTLAIARNHPQLDGSCVVRIAPYRPPNSARAHLEHASSGGMRAPRRRRTSGRDARSRRASKVRLAPIQIEHHDAARARHFDKLAHHRRYPVRTSSRPTMGLPT